MSLPREQALRLYRPPFRHEHGFIWDADGNMVADDRTAGDAAVQVRGWGRIKYLPGAEVLHDAVGELIAEALTEYWQRHAAGQQEGEGGGG